ncbi:MAG: GNAT family N-acetyltransferase [Gemmatimonadaceae bacterium]
MEATESALLVRLAGPADVEVVTAMRGALRLEERPASNEGSRERIRELTWRQLHGADQAFFLAEAQGVAVGLLRCALQYSPDNVVHSALLTTAYVFPAHRRQGIMRQLVDAAIEWCTARGVNDLRLRNAHDNASANAAWEALGFTVVQFVRQRIAPT